MAMMMTLTNVDNDDDDENNDDGNVYVDEERFNSFQTKAFIRLKLKISIPFLLRKTHC